MNPKKISVFAHDPHWKEVYRGEAAAIAQALGDNLVEIHHIGSTAVPGLVAKPKIDITAAVQDPWTIIEPLAVLGYEFRGEWNIPLKFGFRKRQGTAINLHVHPHGHGALQMHLAFRDYLLSNPKVRDEYGSLKEEILQDEMAGALRREFFSNYALAKNDLIRRVYQQTGIDVFWAAYAFHDDEIALLKNQGQELDPDCIFIIFYRGPEAWGYLKINRGSLDCLGYGLFSQQPGDFSQKMTEFLAKWRPCQLFLKDLGLGV